ncbi:MAG: hypothetical protein DHS20C18_06020 [Saprospiraceae bacterium]|nr:MAG: hypothetical protein DHS20C18_06020 [Saprospiraceae bacterium]
MDAKEFAKNWVEAWNSHDMNEILHHYTDDFEITTPMIKMALGIDTGTLKGKEAIADYWSKALEKMPDLKFELYDVTKSVNSIALYYQSVMNKRSIEVMFFNEEGLITKVIAHYTDI